MNARQKRLAAKLYALAMAAHNDTLGAESDEQADVMKLSMHAAQDKLEAMGYDYSHLNSLQRCIDAAKEKHDIQTAPRL